MTVLEPGRWRERKAPKKTGVFVEVEVIKDRDGFPLYLVEVKGYGKHRAPCFGNTKRKSEVTDVAFAALRELTGKQRAHWWIKRLTFNFAEEF